jgi:hypothetical protein
MGLHLDPSEHEPLRPGGRARVGDPGPEHRLIRDGIEQLAHGALVCPGCAMPVALGGPVGAGERLSCGYCRQSARAREFLVRDVYDTPSNEVYLIARVG